MKRVLIAVFAVCLLTSIAVYIIGFFLPEDHSVSRHLTLQATQSDVWDMVTDNYAMKEWDPQLSHVKKLPDSDEGNAVWRFEDNKGGYMVVEYILQTPPEKLISRIVATNYPFSGDWIFTLHEQEGQTTLMIQENGTIHNPFFRFFVHFIIGYGAGIDAFFTALEAHAAAQGSIE